MAKYERCVQGEFDQVLDCLDRGIRTGSGTASFEDGSDLCCGGARVSVRVYTRFSFARGNRVSLTVVLTGEGQTLTLCAITSGDESWKRSVWGEAPFFDQLLTNCEGVKL